MTILSAIGLRIVWTFAFGALMTIFYRVYLRRDRRQVRIQRLVVLAAQGVSFLALLFPWVYGDPTSALGLAGKLNEPIVYIYVGVLALTCLLLLRGTDIAAWLAAVLQVTG